MVRDFVRAVVSACDVYAGRGGVDCVVVAVCVDARQRCVYIKQWLVVITCYAIRVYSEGRARRDVNPFIARTYDDSLLQTMCQKFFSRKIKGVFFCWYQRT